MPKEMFFLKKYHENILEGASEQRANFKETGNLKNICNSKHKDTFEISVRCNEEYRFQNLTLLKTKVSGAHS